MLLGILIYLEIEWYHDHKINTPCLSTEATCCPLTPPLPQANPQTQLSWFFSLFFNLPLSASHTNIMPVVDPDPTYFPSGLNEADAQPYDVWNCASENV
jgi:hypothetical protein